MREQPGSVWKMWNLYKNGGITPALASLLGSPDARQMALIRRMMREKQNQPDMDTELLALDAVVFDLETTGFNAKGGDEIISVGAAAVQGNRLLEKETFYSLVNPKKTIPDHIERLTGISTQEASRAPDLIEVLRQFFSFVNQRVLIAHGAGHDKTFLNQALWKTSRVTLAHRVLDTMMLARWLHPELKSHDLDTMLEHYQIPVGRRHHALDDSEMTARLWARLVEEAAERRVITLGDLYMELSLIRR